MPPVSSFFFLLVIPTFSFISILFSALLLFLFHCRILRLTFNPSHFYLYYILSVYFCLMGFTNGYLGVLELGIVLHLRRCVVFVYRFDSAHYLSANKFVCCISTYLLLCRTCN